MSGPTHFPLAWPQGRPRAKSRAFGSFRSGDKRISVAVAVERLEAELGRLGARYPLLSTNIETTLSGRPRSSAPRPADPGVCVYFQLDGKPYALACDRYTEVADNVAAIAAHVDATRAITRHGVASAAETLQAFQALPAPPTWREVLDLSGKPSAAQVDTAYRRLAAQRHRDRGGSDAAMAELNAARDAARLELGS